MSAWYSVGLTSHGTLWDWHRCKSQQCAVVHLRSWTLHQLTFSVNIFLAWRKSELLGQESRVQHVKYFIMACPFLSSDERAMQCLVWIYSGTLKGIYFIFNFESVVLQNAHKSQINDIWHTSPPFDVQLMKRIREHHMRCLRSRCQHAERCFVRRLII